MVQTRGRGRCQVLKILLKLWQKNKFDVPIIQVSFAGGVAWDGEQIGGQQYLFFRGGNHFHFLPCEHHFHFLSCEQHSRYHCGKHCLHFLYCGNHFHFLHCEQHFHFLYCDTTFTFNIVRKVLDSFVEKHYFNFFSCQHHFLEHSFDVYFIGRCKAPQQRKQETVLHSHGKILL